MYGKNGFVLAEDHILYSIGKFSGQLKAFPAALDAYTQLIDVRTRLSAPSKQSVNQQLAYFREFLGLYRLMQLNQEKRADATEVIEEPIPELPELPVPWFNAQKCMLLTDASAIASENSDNNKLNAPKLASGITFSNCLPEHKELWLGLERLLLEEVFKSMAKSAIPPLLTEDTNNLRCAELSLGESCCYEIPVTNPLMVSLTICDVVLKYRFHADGSSEISSSVDGIERTKVGPVELKPSETKSLRFNLCCSKLGKVFVEGVRFSLSLTPETSGVANIQESSQPVLVSGYQNISVKGPRLNNNLANRSSVKYGVDKRLEIDVIPPLPKLKVTFSDMPEALFCGQVIKVKVIIKNIGSMDVNEILLSNADPTHAFFLSDSSSNDLRVTNKRVQRIPLPEKGFLGVHEEVQGYLWIKALQAPGMQDLLLVFYCHVNDEKTSPKSKTNKRFRLLRHHSQFTILPSIGMAVSCSSSVSVPTASESRVEGKRDDCVVLKSSVDCIANMVIDVSALEQENVSQTFTIVGVSSYSKKWILKSFDGNLTQPPLTLNTSESAKVLVRCYSCENEKSDFSKDSSFSVVPFGKELSKIEEESSLSFASLSRIDFPALTSVAELPAPAADNAPPDIHPSLKEYLDIRNTTHLGMVVTIHWHSRHSSQHSSPSAFGQLNVFLENLGDSVFCNLPPPKPPAADSLSHSVVPAQIIPVTPPTLPQIPTNFSLSVGLDMAHGDGGSQCRADGCLTVAQATALYHQKEVDVTSDLSAGHLMNCVKVSADFVPSVTHDFEANKWVCFSHGINSWRCYNELICSSVSQFVMASFHYWFFFQIMSCEGCHHCPKYHT